MISGGNLCLLTIFNRFMRQVVAEWRLTCKHRAYQYKEIDDGNITYKPEEDLEMHRFTKQDGHWGMQFRSLMASTISE